VSASLHALGFLLFVGVGCALVAFLAVWWIDR
jgi:hypothetical protein